MNEAKQPPTSNQVIEHDDYIEVDSIGVQTVESMYQMFEKFSLIIEDFKAHKKPLLVLVKVIDPGPPNLPTFKEGMELLHRNPVDRLALCGNLNGPTMLLLNTTIGSLSREYDIKFFDQEAKALAWLREFKKIKLA